MADETSLGSHISPGSGPYDEIIQEEDGGHQNPAYESLDPPTDRSYVNDPQPSPEPVETFPGSDISPGSAPYDEIVPQQTAGGHQKPAYESLDPPTETTYVNDPQPSPYTALNSVQNPYESLDLPAETSYVNDPQPSPYTALDPIQNPKPGSVENPDSMAKNPLQDMDAGEYIHNTGSPN